MMSKQATKKGAHGTLYLYEGAMSAPIRFRIPRPLDESRLYAGLGEYERLTRKAADADGPRHRWAIVVAARHVLLATYRDAGLVPGGEA